MGHLELPLKKRSKKYRFFEMFPALLSYTMIALMVILSFVSPMLAAIYLLALIVTMLVRALTIATYTVSGHKRMDRAQRIDWNERLAQLEVPADHLEGHAQTSSGYDYMVHRDNIKKIAENPDQYPRPSQLYHGVIIAAYNEPYEVIQPTLQSLVDSTYDLSRMIVVFAYEERGGDAIRQVVGRLEKEYSAYFKAFIAVMHPADLPGEVVGKGPNITYAAQELEEWLTRQDIEKENVIITTLDCDNKPYPSYFDYVAYEYIVHENRKHLSYQPIALYTGNIWDAPAPMRVIATGNSFWTIIVSMREDLLRNFAAHSQPMSALSEMNYWSKRSIVEDGHQYWRSYFHFKGDYGVIPIHVPIYQDAVMADTLKKTFVTQFKQLRRWSYGASDVPYVAVRLFSRARKAPFWPLFVNFVRLVEGHVSLAVVAVLIAFGGWIPLFLNPAASDSIAAHNLPEVISYIQRFAMIGILITIFVSFKILPPRPERYKRSRNVMMVLQWLLMPITAICYGSLAAFNAQTHLLFAKYLDKFDVTEKATAELVDKKKQK